MSRAAHRTAAVALAGVLASACTSSATAPEAGSDATPGGAPASSPTAATAEGPSEPADAQGHDALEAPATSSGPLTQRDFPRPAELGRGWSYRVDMGDAEEGYTGNSTPVLERDPAEMAMLAVPFGCPRPVDVPVPEHALEVDYTAAGVSVVTVRASFGDPRTASRFFGTRARLLRGCRGTAVSEAEGVIVDEVRRVSDSSLLNDRTPESDPWTELVVHDRDQVVLIAAQTRLGAAPLTPDALADLVQAFRR